MIDLRDLAFPVTIIHSAKLLTPMILHTIVSTRWPPTLWWPPNLKWPPIVLPQVLQARRWVDSAAFLNFQRNTIYSPLGQDIFYPQEGTPSDSFTLLVCKKAQYHALMTSTPLFQERHNRVWNAIFQNETWTSIASSHGLNPTAVGENLHSIYDIDHTTGSQWAYIVLVIGDKSGDIRSYSQTLFDSLRPHTFNETTEEVVFTKSRIVLNIHDALSNLAVSFTDPERLFSYQDNRLRSAYLY